MLPVQYLFIPAKYKDCYLAYLLNEFAGQSILVFTTTCNNTQRAALLLRNLGFQAICLHGQMTQPNRLGALNKFKAKERNILIATDVASRGLDSKWHVRHFGTVCYRLTIANSSCSGLGDQFRHPNSRKRLHSSCGKNRACRKIWQSSFFRDSVRH